MTRILYAAAVLCAAALALWLVLYQRTDTQIDMWDGSGL